MAIANVSILIVTLNWNGWSDTLECLESVLRMATCDFKVMVCDNDSSDDSINLIEAWARGDLDVLVSQESPLRNLSFPPIRKPIPYRIYSRAEAEMGGREDDVCVPLILVKNGENRGFAAGNNVALRYFLNRQDFSQVWLLNNDTVVESDALTALVDRLNQVPTAGIAGSTLPYYSDPDRIWALGGATYNIWSSMSQCIGLGDHIAEPVAIGAVESKMSYVAGASMLVTRAFVQDVGLMSEDYFLYFEEPDWAWRGRKRYSLAYAKDSVVYHKVGASTSRVQRQSAVNWRFKKLLIRNRLLFTWKFRKIALPTVVLVVLWTELRAALRRFYGR